MSLVYPRWLVVGGGEHKVREEVKEDGWEPCVLSYNFSCGAVVQGSAIVGLT